MVGRGKGGYPEGANVRSVRTPTVNWLAPRSPQDAERIGFELI